MHALPSRPPLLTASRALSGPVAPLPGPLNQPVIFDIKAVDPILARSEAQPRSAARPHVISVLEVLDLDRQKFLAALAERGGGSVLRGWRREVDPDGSLDVGTQELCRAAERLGFHCQEASLLGADCPTLTLEEVAPAQDHLVRRFREWVKATFNGPVGFFQALNRNGQGKLPRDDFVAGCRAHNFQSSYVELEELFNFLDTEDTGSIAKEDTLFLETDAAIRDGEVYHLKMRSKQQLQRLLAYVYWDDGRNNTPKDRRAQRPWLASTFEKLPVIVCEKRLNHQREQRKRKEQAQEFFVSHIRATFGNEVRGWRRALDPECRFQVDRRSLRRYCRCADLAIDFNALWSALDRDGDGTFTMEELHPRAAHVLATTRHWARQRFGSCSAVWDLPEVVEFRRTLQMEGRWVSDKKMLISVFTQALKVVGWPGASGSESFVGNMLDLYGCGFISLPDLWWLDAWEPPNWLYEDPDPAAWEELRALMLRAYQHPLRAWRALDSDNTNEVCWLEFLDACRKLKFKGNVGGAWRCLDDNLSGTISMKEYDAASAELLGSFKALAEANYGSVELAFKAFDSDGDGLLTLSELRRACRRLRWQGEVRQLFTSLGVSSSKDGSKKGLALADIAFLDSWAADPEEEGRSTPCTARSSSKTRSRSANPLGSVSPSSVGAASSAAAGTSAPVPAPTPASALAAAAASAAAASPSARAPSSTAAWAVPGATGEWHELDAEGSAPFSSAATTIALPEAAASASRRQLHGPGPGVVPTSPGGKPPERLESERLYRTYHCMAAKERKRPLPRSRSLPWLERIYQIDAADLHRVKIPQVRSPP